MAKNPRDSVEYLFGQIDEKLVTIMKRQKEIIDRQVGWEKECDARHGKNEQAISELQEAKAKATGALAAASMIGGFIGAAIEWVRH